jgi:hypothetical protein
MVLVIVCVTLLPLLGGCAPRFSKLHAVAVPPDSLRLAQVASLIPRAQVLSAEFVVRSLQASGISEADINDGSIAGGRVECCGGPNEQETAIIFYVPKGINVQVGDVVEIHSGSPGDLSNPSGPVNMLTRIREKQNDFGRQCRWDPPDPELRGRILYCDWMQAEGWKLERIGLGQYWLRLSR